MWVTALQVHEGLPHGYGIGGQHDRKSPSGSKEQPQSAIGYRRSAYISRFGINRHLFPTARLNGKRIQLVIDIESTQQIVFLSATNCMSIRNKIHLSPNTNPCRLQMWRHRYRPCWLIGWTGSRSSTRNSVRLYSSRLYETTKFLLQ